MALLASSATNVLSISGTNIPQHHHHVQSQLHDIMRHLQSSNSSPLGAAASEDKQEPRGEADDTQELSSWARRELFFSEEQATVLPKSFRGLLVRS